MEIVVLLESADATRHDEAGTQPAGWRLRTLQTSQMPYDAITDWVEPQVTPEHIVHWSLPASVLSSIPDTYRAGPIHAALVTGLRPRNHVWHAARNIQDSVAVTQLTAQLSVVHCAAFVALV